ncbi:MAG: ribonuclease III [Deltaproteobacteria bacterium]|nr:ribonuclease III [Deltaproteobacteria bacterium]
MERIDKRKLKEIERRISYSFKNRELLASAMTHKSYANEAHLALGQDNERLEFLGDTVLELVISELLMERFPDRTEGDLSKLRAAIVNEKQLADMARSLGLGNDLLLGKGEERTGGRTKNSLLADAYEALLGAIYKDRGFKKAAAFIRRHYRDSVPESPETVVYQDYKTLLQEKVQSFFKEAPRYRIAREYGPDHSKTFEVNLFIHEKLYGVGTGKSKKEAEQVAARMALEQIEAEQISDQLIPDAI